jgi:hypothetical protein
MRLSLDDPEPAGANLVLEVASPKPCVIVRAADGVSVALPAVGLTIVPRVEGDIQFRASGTTFVADDRSGAATRRVAAAVPTTTGRGRTLSGWRCI